jgi:cyclic beta-1,2-glucan synthetase
LWTLKAACDELIARPIVGREVIAGIEDAILLAQAEQGARTEGLIALADEQRGAIEGELRGALAALDTLHAALVPRADAQRSIEWLARARDTAAHARDELLSLAPFAALREPPATLTAGALGERFAPIHAAVLQARSPAQIAALQGLGDSGATLAAPSVLGQLGALRDEAGALDAEARAYLGELSTALEDGCDRAGQLCEALAVEGMRAQAFADGMSFSFLLDQDRTLFSIGYNVGAAKLDGSHYDLLASEARLASLFAIAKGDVPEKHWFRLGRPRTSLGDKRALLAWSGSMFEYLMPLLVTKNNPDTLLHETCESAVLAHHDYGKEHDVPWGISEAAYNVMDLSMTYQYRAFGVPALGLKAGLGDDHVIAPYATALAAQVRPDLALPNLQAIAREGGLGEFGCYESIDYTVARVPPGRKGVVVKAYFAHHQGMSLVALDNVVNDAPMLRRFHSDPRVQATELLLEERVPTSAPVLRDRIMRSPAPPATEGELSAVEHVSLSALGQQRAHLLGHGELATLITARGTGYTTWRKLDVNRYREDAQLEPSGIFIYVRDRTAESTWSAGYEPTRATPSSYDAAFAPHRVDIQRRDGNIETHVHVTVSPEHAADVRRLTLINHGASACELEVTTYTEIVLAHRAADRAHRAFSGMFVETELVTQTPSMRPSAPGASDPGPRRRCALLATRRPRKGGELQPWLTQVLACEAGDWSDVEHETSREAFIGRGRSLQAPRALDEGVRLAARAGGVIDPAFALRRVVKLAPGEHATITLTTAIASSRAEALDLAQLFSAQSTIDRTFELAWADATVELRHLGISANQSHRFQRLLTAVCFPQASLRAELPVEQLHGDGRRVLWSQGLADDLPLIIVRIDESSPGELCRELLLAHEFFRLNHEQVELLLLSEEPGGYLQPVHDATLALVHGRLAHGQLDQRGGIFVRRTNHLSPQERALLLAAGRVVLQVGHGSLSRQLRRAAERAASLAPVLPIKDADSGLVQVTRGSRPSSPERPRLQFDNGYGGFSEDGREYVMQVSAKKRPPAPWCNVIASPMFGTLVSEAGGGFTWSQNSQRHRITAWSNDATRDPVGEVIYLRDDDDGSVWSATPAPAGGDASYTVRHGQGYSVFSHTRARLEHELVVSIDFERPVKLFKLTLRNGAERARAISVIGFIDWVLGANRDVSRTGVVTRWDRNARTLFASGFLSAFPHRCAFFTSSETPRSITADRAELFGDGDAQKPRALERTALSGHTGFGYEPCAALHNAIRIEPGGQHVITFALGEGESAEDALALARAFAEPAPVEVALARTRDAWDELLSNVQVQTPDRALDVLLNRFLPYQVLSCRFWARSAFYQSGGAYGFRDQLQDVLGLLHMRPDLAREHILRSAARQFPEGDVQHWWHPDTGEGVRTRCSDDMLWLPFATAEYVRVTGDRAILDESVTFLEERKLEPSDHDIYSVPRVAEARASLYEHCVRAIEAGLTAGEHGLPLMRGGDWNDGMDRVGVEGKGESVWLGFFIVRVLLDFAEVARLYGDNGRAQTFLRAREVLAAALEEHGWDGEWYRRAFCDDGTLLGSAQSPECRIDAIAQSWAVISGCASSARGSQALEQAEAQLLKDDVMLLLTPPFTGAVADPGYIRAYPPGVRENGGQYTHGALWMVQALSLQGEHERAYAMLSRLNPIHHARTEAQVARYRIEPYVIAADIYYAPGLEGRGGWSWYTGAAGWLYRIALEHILGFTVRDGHVQIAPVAPLKLDRYRICYKNAGTTLEIEVERGATQHAAGAWLDGALVAEGRARMPRDGGTHTLKVTLAPLASASVPVRESAE